MDSVWCTVKNTLLVHSQRPCGFSKKHSWFTIMDSVWCTVKTLCWFTVKDPVVSVKNTRGSQLWTLLVHSKNTLLVHSQRPCGFSKKHSWFHNYGLCLVHS